MKKVLTLLTALLLTFTLASGSFTGVFAAEESGAAEETEKEYVRFIGGGFDPYASFEFSEDGQNDTIDPDSVRWAAIRQRTSARYNENGVEYIAQFYINPAAEPFIPVNYNYSGEWETVIVDMTSVAALYGRESIWDSDHYTGTRQIRLDPLEPDRDAENFDDSTGRGIVTEGDYIDIAWIAFFESEEDAKAYNGTGNTPYCLLDVNSLSSPFLVHNLTAEYVRVQSDDEPVVTEAPVEITGPSALFALNYEDDINDALFSGSKNIIDDVSFGDGCYVINVPAGGDQNIELCFGALTSSGDIDPISADDNKILQFGVRIIPDEGGINGNIYWQTDMHPGYSEPQNQAYKYAPVTDVQVVTIDFTKIKKWEGNVGNLRFDPFPETSESTTVELYYIAFFTNLESAEAFEASFLAEGLPATPEPTVKPTAAPTPEPTEVPAATDVPATAAPASDEPDDNGSNGDNGSDGTEKDTGKKGLSTGAAIGIVAGVVAAAAIAAGIIVANSKKKNK